MTLLSRHSLLAVAFAAAMLLGQAAGQTSLISQANAQAASPAPQIPAPASASINIDLSAAGTPISPMLYGIFFEEINRAGDGGLYAEMLQNRSFEDAPIPLGWSLESTERHAQARIALDRTHPLNPANPTSLRFDILQIGPGQKVGIANQGFKGVPAPDKTYPEFLKQLASGAWLPKYEAAARSTENGLNVQAGHVYDLTFYARASSRALLRIDAALERQNGTLLAGRSIVGLGAGWRQFKTSFTAADSDTDARLVLWISQPATVWLDNVSLFPRDTYLGRPNGLRPDLARMLAALHPAFVRFPGGSYAEGHLLRDSYHWKQTIGDPAARPGHWNIWGYRSSDGLGYREYLQMCEDLQAEPLFVVNCGMAEQEFVPVNQLGPWIQDALDAIEYADGPVTSRWGAARARDGHPKPFGLKYMEIGNENGLDYPWGGGTPAQYLARYRPFYDAIKARYPGMTVISNIDLPAPKDIVDEHYYDTSNWFEDNAHRYDAHPRSGPKIYVGEYAANKDAGDGNLRAALGEAAFMTGLERNGDIVAMASYAPLLANAQWRRWSPNAIVFDSARAYGTPSYYVQAMFAGARPDICLPLTLLSSNSAPQRLYAVAGLKRSTNQLILKIVNAGAQDMTISVSIGGALPISTVAQAQVLSSASPLDENSFESPHKVFPRDRTFSVNDSSFDYTAPANSVTIIKITERSVRHHG